MVKYRRRGGFCRLMQFSSVLSLQRYFLLALCVWLYWGAGACVPALAMLLLSLLAACAEALLRRRFGLACRTGCVLAAIADACTCLVVLLLAALHFPPLTIPACILFALTVPGFTGRIRRAIQPAV